MLFRQRVKAFTLIELLVVIAIIAVLMAILMPSLRKAKQQAGAMNCMANAKTLSLGWYMYVGDNDGRIMSAHMDRPAAWIKKPRNESGTEYSSTQTSPPVEDEDEIRGIKAGELFPYVEDPGCYHCPSDNIRKSVYDNGPIFTTYVVPSCLNGGMFPKKQIVKYDRIRMPTKKYNFVEAAEPRNYNMNGWFVIGSPEVTGSGVWKWWGPMAINHGDSSILGFCDGHAEKHKWRDKFTIERPAVIQANGRSTYGQEAPPADQQQDLKYMAEGWAYEHKF